MRTIFIALFLLIATTITSMDRDQRRLMLMQERTQLFKELECGKKLDAINHHLFKPGLLWTTSFLGLLALESYCPGETDIGICQAKPVAYWGLVSVCVGSICYMSKKAIDSLRIYHDTYKDVFKK